MKYQRSLILATLILVAFIGCKEDEVSIKEPIPTEQYAITFTKSFIQYFYEAIIISDQDGEVLYEGILADWPQEEDFVVELEKEEGQVLSLTVLSGNSNFDGENTSFGNTTYYDVANGATIGVHYNDDYLLTGPQMSFTVKIANVVSLDSIEVMSGYNMPQDIQLAGDTLTLNLQKGQWEAVFFKLKVNGEDEMKYFYRQSEQQAFYLDVSDLKNDLEAVTLQMPFSSFWSGSIRAATTPDPLPKTVQILSRQHDYPTSEQLTIEVPPGLTLHKYYIALFGHPLRYRYVLTELPSALEDYSIETEDRLITPDQLHFSILSPADLVLVNYSFSPLDPSSNIGAGTWKVISASDEVDFVFPAISEQMNSVIPTYDGNHDAVFGTIEAYKFDEFEAAEFEMFPRVPHKYSLQFKAAQSVIVF